MPLIGFIQGRLSPMIEGKIQAFPWPYWREEFVLAPKYGFSLMEWTLDQDRLHENPLLTPEGQKEIRDLGLRHGVSITSLTGDCFMQAPFFKASAPLRTQLLDDMEKILVSCAALGITWVVLPLVDNGRLENTRQKENLLEGLRLVTGILKDADMYLVFESDFPPAFLATFIDELDPRFFGINYDIGNSAALGYNPLEEIAAYGNRILNVHVKDRTRGGGTVPLGKGDADIPAALRALRAGGYAGQYILQTARAADGDHAGVLTRYRGLVEEWLREVEGNGPPS
jgi:L-ribulose-5-phosphate 3-epimerase